MRFATRISILFVMFAAAALTVCAQAAKGTECPPQRTISVSGSATVSVDADLAVVHVGFKFYAPDANTAYAKATQTSNAIMSALTGLSIPKTDIEGSDQSLQHTSLFELQQDPANRAQREFTVAQSWTARVAPDQAAKVLDAAIRAGANDSGSIDWTVRDTAPLEAEAAGKAVQNAHAIAEKIAASSGVRLGKLLTASEGQSTPIFPRPMMMAMAKNAEQQPLAVNARRVQVSMTVNAAYEIE